MVFGLLPLNHSLSFAAQAFLPFAYGVGLSLFCFWFISAAPVWGGTYFSLSPQGTSFGAPRQRKVGKRKSLTRPACRCPLRAETLVVRNEIRPRTALVSDKAFIRSSVGFAPRRRAHHALQTKAGLARNETNANATNGADPSKATNAKYYTNSATGRPKNQTGVAIISALLIVALSAILVSGILWRQQVQVRRIENQRLLSQAQWIARGALDWTRLILRSEGDASAGITYLGGVWNVPIARTRLSDLLGQIGEVRQEEGTENYLSGSIEDAQSKFNLRNLVSSPAPSLLQLNVEQIEAFQRLLGLLSLNGQLAKNAAVQLRNGLAQSATRFQMQCSTTGTTATATSIQGGVIGGSHFTSKPGLDDNDATVAQLQMTSIYSLLDVPGFTPETVERLRPFVTLLPTTTAVNMNTAPAEVVAAVVPEMSLSSARAFVARRENVFFHNVGDVELALQGVGVTQLAIDANLFDVNTSYFFVHGRVQHERAEVDRMTLVYRDALTHTTRIVRIQDQL